MKIFTNNELNKKIETFCRLHKKRKDFSEHYKFVVSAIYLMPYVDRRFLEDDFIFINHYRLRKLISEQEIVNILKNLVSLGILECDNHFLIGEKSRGYKLINRLSYKWTLTDLKDSNLSTKIEKEKLFIKNNISGYGNGYKIVSLWNDYLEINYEKAKKFIENHFERGSDKFKSALSSISLIKHQEFFQTVDDTSYRFHSNLTNLPTPLRKFLTINSQKLYNIDIKCSQPTFLALIMLKRPGIAPKELSELLDVCSRGMFYEYMAEKAGLDLDLNDYEVRKYFKEKIFSGCLFDKNRKTLSKWEKIFEICFPSIFAEIRKLKSERYNTLAIMLQKEESEFIFKTVNKISKVISKQTPLLTIHDSIISNSEGIDKVLECMKYEFSIKYNFYPILSIEEL